MVEPIFSAPIFMDYILPFILVFTLVFAILQKTKLFGDNTKQINALIGLITGLILIAFPFSRDFIILLMPFLAVSVVILLIFMMLYGFIWARQGDVLHKGVKIALAIIMGLGLLTVILIIGGWWNGIYEFLFEREGAGQIWINVLLIVVIAVAVIVVVVGKDKSEKKE